MEIRLILLRRAGTRLPAKNNNSPDHRIRNHPPDNHCKTGSHVQMKKVMTKLILWCALTVFFYSCSVSREAFNPEKKYSVEALQQDYRLFRNILEDSHPGIYWYTPKDSMNTVFENGYRSIRDSMTEPQFKNILSSVVTSIQCGHTSVRYSKNYSEWQDTAKVKLFPFGLKFWNDTMVVTLNINRKRFHPQTRYYTHRN